MANKVKNPPAPPTFFETLNSESLHVFTQWRNFEVSDKTKQKTLEKALETWGSLVFPGTGKDLSLLPQKELKQKFKTFKSFKNTESCIKDSVKLFKTALKDKNIALWVGRGCKLVCVAAFIAAIVLIALQVFQPYVIALGLLGVFSVFLVTKAVTSFFINKKIRKDFEKLKPKEENKLKAFYCEWLSKNIQLTVQEKNDPAYKDFSGALFSFTNDSSWN